MRCYNNTGIPVIIVIHVIILKGLQDNSIAVIGNKDKSQNGNYQVNVLCWQCAVTYRGLKVYPFTLVIFPCFLLHHNAINVHKRRIFWYVFVYGLCNWSVNAAKEYQRIYWNKRCPAVIECSTVRAYQTLCQWLLSRTINCKIFNKPAQVRVALSVHKMFTYSCASYSNQEQNCTRFFIICLQVLMVAREVQWELIRVWVVKSKWNGVLAM